MVKWAWKLTMTLWTLRLKEWEYGDNMWAGLILGAVCHYAWGQQTSEVLPKTRLLRSGSWGRIVRLQWNGNGSLVSKSPPPVHSPTCTHFPRVKWVGTPQIPPRHRYKPAELRQRCRLWPVAAAGNVHSNGQWLTLLCFYSRLLFAMHLSVQASETFLLFDRFMNKQDVRHFPVGKCNEAECLRWNRRYLFPYIHISSSLVNKYLDVQRDSI